MKNHHIPTTVVNSKLSCDHKEQADTNATLKYEGIELLLYPEINSFIW